MDKFEIKFIDGSTKMVEAAMYANVDGFTTFQEEDLSLVYSVKTNRVESIERKS